jgi:hypothetical protein
MAKPEHIRAVRRVIGLVEGLLIGLAEIGDDLSAIQDETADAARLDTALIHLASAKDSAGGALAMLRQWVIEAEADDAGEAEE